MEQEEEDVSTQGEVDVEAIVPSCGIGRRKKRSHTTTKLLSDKVLYQWEYTIFAFRKRINHISLQFTEEAPY